MRRQADTYCRLCCGRGYFLLDWSRSPGERATIPCSCTRTGGERELEKEENDRFYGRDGQRPFGGW